MPKFISTEAAQIPVPTRSKRRAFSIIDMLAGLAVIFVTICFALATKRDMMSAEAPWAPASELVAARR